MGGLLARSPWWAASAAFHLVLLISATFLGFAARPAREERRVEVGVRGPERRPPPPRKAPRAPTPEGPEDVPEVFFPEARESDRWETPDNDPLRRSRGESPGYKSFLPGTAGGILGTLPVSLKPGETSTLGVGLGGGSAGRAGPPGPGGMEALRRRQTERPKTGTQPAVVAGLSWLARHQDPDGRWSTGGFDRRCGGAVRCGGPGSRDHDVGLTGLSLLAFLGAGYLPTSRFTIEDPSRKGRLIRFADTVRDGLRWLKDSQDPEGCFAREAGEFLYDHAIATLAMAEAAWLCGSPLYREPAQRGIDFLVRAQNPGLAWRYTVRPGDNDTSVTGWCVMALKSAELSGLRFDQKASYEGVRQWLKRATSTRGVVGYEAPGDLGSTMPGINDRWQGHPAMTAVGLLIKIFVDRRQNDPWLKVAAQEIVKDLPAWDEEHRTIDFYYWYYAALALFQYDAPRGPAWKAFDESMKKALVPFQQGRGAGCREGSWDPAVDRWGAIGGRIYATAINVLTLEVYYRYDSVFVGARQGRSP